MPCPNTVLGDWGLLLFQKWGKSISRLADPHKRCHEAAGWFRSSLSKQAVLKPCEKVTSLSVVSSSPDDVWVKAQRVWEHKTPAERSPKPRSRVGALRDAPSIRAKASAQSSSRRWLITPQQLNSSRRSVCNEEKEWQQPWEWNNQEFCCISNSSTTLDATRGPRRNSPATSPPSPNHREAQQESTTQLLRALSSCSKVLCPQDKGGRWVITQL